MTASAFFEYRAEVKNTLPMICLLYTSRILVAHHDGDKDALDGTGVVHYTTVDTGLSGFPDAPYIILGEPFDVRFEQRVLHVLELGLSDNSFNPVSYTHLPMLLLILWAPVWFRSSRLR